MLSLRTTVHRRRSPSRAVLSFVVTALDRCDTRAMTAAGTRARVRAALTREIVDAARRHLAADGAAGLSLRAVARELGMASSAVYRYFPSRDDLLTALIVEAYDALGAAAEEAEADGPRTDLRARLQAVCGAVRGGRWPTRTSTRWSTARRCPATRRRGRPIGPAARVGTVLARIVADGVAAGVRRTGDGRRGRDPATAGIAAEVGLPGRPRRVRRRPGSSRPGRRCSAW